MKTTKSSATRRKKGKKGNEGLKLVSKLLSHLVLGPVLLLSMVLVESALILALSKITAFVNEPLFTDAVQGLDGLLFLADAYLFVRYVVVSIKKFSKGDEL